MQNLRFRAQIVQEADKDARMRGVAREMARRDPLFFFNVFLWTYAVVTAEKHVPFVTWDFQDGVIRSINEGIEAKEDIFIDKSRDMGATWMVLGVFFWRWLFKDAELFRIGSRKEEYVDQSGNMDTHFEKFRYILDRLPWWMKPAGFEERRHSTYMKILNPANGSVLVGEATNANFARGGRQTAVLFDEFQNWEKAEEAWRSASDATRCKIALGTPEGAGNKFAELARTEEVRRKIRIWWYLHPHKANTTDKYREIQAAAGKLHENQSGLPVVGVYRGLDGKIRSPWYDEQERRRTRDDLAANVDIDYLTTGRPVFDTVKCKLMGDLAVLPLKTGDLLWKVRPIFNESGDCINREQLEVEFVPNLNGILSIWEEPKGGFEFGYCIGADTAEGLEQGDYDSAYVLKRTGERPEVVAALHGHIRIHEYAEELAKLGVWYRRAYVNIERNQHGHGVIAHTMRLYSRLWHKAIHTRGHAELTDQIGFVTGSNTKGIIIGTLGKAIHLDEIRVPDPQFWKETLTFVEDNGRMEAQGKSQGQRTYDDRVMALAITLYTHLNMPLPAQVQEGPSEREMWMARRKKKPEKGLVGWVV